MDNELILQIMTALTNTTIAMLELEEIIHKVAHRGPQAGCPGCEPYVRASTINRELVEKLRELRKNNNSG